MGLLKFTLLMQSTRHKWTENYFAGDTSLPPTDPIVGTAARGLAQVRANLLGAGAWINAVRVGVVGTKRKTWLWNNPMLDPHYFVNVQIPGGQEPFQTEPQASLKNATGLNTATIFRFGLASGFFSLRYLSGWPDANLQSDEALFLQPAVTGALNLVSSYQAYIAYLTVSPATGLGNWQLQIKNPAPTAYGSVDGIVYSPTNSTLNCTMHAGATLPPVGSKVILRGGRVTPSYRHLYQVFTVFNTDSVAKIVFLYARTPPTGVPSVLVSPTMYSVGPVPSNITAVLYESVAKRKRGDKGFSVPSGKARPGP